MNLKKLILPVAAMSLVLAGCNSGGSSTKTYKWDEESVAFMEQNFGAVLPALTGNYDYNVDYGLEEGTIYFEGMTSKSFSKIVRAVDKFCAAIYEMGYVGFYEIEDYYQDAVRGEFTFGLNSTITDEDEEFPACVRVEISAALEQTYFGNYSWISMSARIDTDFKTMQTFPMEQVAKVVGEGVTVEYPAEATSFGYRYIHETSEGEEYTYLQVKYTGATEYDQFVSSLGEQAFYIQKTNYPVYFGYRMWALPWIENYRVTVENFASFSDHDEMILLYGTYQPAVITAGFPVDFVCETIGLEDASQVVYPECLDTYGYKQWVDSEDGSACIDLIDPMKADPTREETIYASFTTALVEDYNFRQTEAGKFAKEVGDQYLYITISETDAYYVMISYYLQAANIFTEFPSEKLADFLTEQGFENVSYPVYAVASENAYFELDLEYLEMGYFTLYVYNSTEQEYLDYKALLDADQSWTLYYDDAPDYYYSYGDTSLQCWLLDYTGDPTDSYYEIDFCVSLW